MKVRNAPTKLPPSAFEALINILENVEQPLGDLCTALWNSSIATCSQFSIGVTIAALLQDELLPKPSQRLVAIYILYHMIVSRHVISSASSSSSIDKLVDSPLTIILFELADHSHKRLPEQLFLSHLLTHSQQSSSSNHVVDNHQSIPPVPTQISQAPAATLWNALEGAMRSGAAVPKLNITSVKSLWTARHPLPSNSNQNQNQSITANNNNLNVLPPISGVVLDADHQYSNSQNINNNQNNNVNDQGGQLYDDLQSVVTLEDFTPSFVRIPPPMLPIGFDNNHINFHNNNNSKLDNNINNNNNNSSKNLNVNNNSNLLKNNFHHQQQQNYRNDEDLMLEEMKWIDVELLHEIQWDHDMGIRNSIALEVKEILSKAFKSPIPESLQMKVLQNLEQDWKIIYICGLTPKKLPDLIENNSTLAAKLLAKLFNLNFNSASQLTSSYLGILAQMDINLHSMEVVNLLSTSTKLPADFLHTYISNCIQHCGNIHDKYKQSRMVRFVCMFLKNLMKNKSIDVQHHHIEVQKFCMDFSRIREVTDLFRSLKHLGAQQ